MSIITVDKVVDSYTATREKIRSLEEEIKKLKEVQTKKEEWLLTELQKQGQTGAQTPHGTVYLTTKESVTVADWDAVLEWVKDGERFEFLNKAVNKTAVLEMMTDDRSVPPPPGVNFSSCRVAQIRSKK